MKGGRQGREGTSRKASVSPSRSSILLGPHKLAPHQHTGVSEGPPCVDLDRCIAEESCSIYPMEKANPLTLHQSMKGLPRCGVATVVSERGVYSSGLMCVMRYRQSSPPIEWARKLTPRPGALSWRNL